jgi:hypothetical protein
MKYVLMFDLHFNIAKLPIRKIALNTLNALTEPDDSNICARIIQKMNIEHKIIKWYFIFNMRQFLKCSEV